jgi:hypothetical protein
MTDYYLQDRVRLHKQPKATIAEYVEQNGILVPRRFTSLAQARSSGIPFLARSEHPQEYDGVSGLLESFPASKLASISSEQELKEKCDEYPMIERRLSNISQYCAFLGISEQDFRRDISYSFWELLEGYNRTIVADSARPDCYHIMTKSRDNQIQNYTIVEKGNITQAITPLPPELKESLTDIIQMYETIRNLSHFNPIHCPIMEIQTCGNKNYFLQYHRTRDFKQSTFALERPPFADEKKALFVRGATPPEGITVDVTLSYAMFERFPYEQNEKGFSDFKLPTEEQASFDKHYYSVFTELMLPRRRVQITNNSLEGEYVGAIIGHNVRSKLYKPEISLIDWPPIYNSRELIDMKKKALQTGQDQKIKVHVVSDGTTAYIQRI